MKTVETYTATIYVGLRQGYTKEIRSIQMVKDWLQTYANSHSICVTVTPTDFIYKLGNEPGVAVGIINYPRLPATREALEIEATEIAFCLMTALNQHRVSVVLSDKTIMLEAE